MELPLQVVFRGMDRSAAVEARVTEQSVKLERYFDRITSGRVTIEAPGHNHHHKGTLFHVRIDLTVPGDEIVVGREPGQDARHTDVYAALEDAFAAAARQLKAHADRHGSHHGYGHPGPRT